MAHRSSFPTPQELFGGEGELQALIRTSMGDFRVRLFEQLCPKTVANFVGLATGALDWIDPRSGEPGEGSYYAEVPIHRVIEGFMFQAGDRTGTGRGGPGYTFDDECSQDAKHDAAGRLSMANAGRRGPHGTNGSQFFVTLSASPHLDGKHTVFGEVLSGMETIQKIAGVATDREDRPLSELLVVGIDVSRI